MPMSMQTTRTGLAAATPPATDDLTAAATAAAASHTINKRKADRKATSAVDTKSTTDMHEVSTQQLDKEQSRILGCMGLLLLGMGLVAIILHAKYSREISRLSQDQQQQPQQHQKPTDNHSGNGPFPPEVQINFEDNNSNSVLPPSVSASDQSALDLFDCGPMAWPHLVGAFVDEARKQIYADNPCVHVQITIFQGIDSLVIVPRNSVLYDPDRVWIYMNADKGTVARIPFVEGRIQECGPTRWPSLLDVNVNDARAQILKENRCVYVQILAYGGNASKDFDPQRVRLYMNTNNGLVVSLPAAGN